MEPGLWISLKLSGQAVGLDCISEIAKVLMKISPKLWGHTNLKHTYTCFSSIKMCTIPHLINASPSFTKIHILKCSQLNELLKGLYLGLEHCLLSFSEKHKYVLFIIILLKDSLAYLIYCNFLFKFDID